MRGLTKNRQPGDARNISNIEEQGEIQLVRVEPLRGLRRDLLRGWKCRAQMQLNINLLDEEFGVKFIINIQNMSNPKHRTIL
jgi:hypothetical protein